MILVPIGRKQIIIHQICKNTYVYDDPSLFLYNMIFQRILYVDYLRYTHFPTQIYVYIYMYIYIYILIYFFTLVFFRIHIYIYIK